MHQNFLLLGRGKARQLTASPTAPNPNIATDEPFLGLATFSVAPRPSITKPMK